MIGIVNKNNKGQLHGYQEWYTGGKLYLKGFWYNGKLDDYEEWYYYYYGGKLKKTFYI